MALSYFWSQTLMPLCLKFRALLNNLSADLPSPFCLDHRSHGLLSPYISPVPFSFVFLSRAPGEPISHFLYLVAPSSASPTFAFTCFIQPACLPSAMASANGRRRKAWAARLMRTRMQGCCSGHIDCRASARVSSSLASTIQPRSTVHHNDHLGPYSHGRPLLTASVSRLRFCTVCLEMLHLTSCCSGETVTARP
ncbi:hypothetical protein BKA81DRAFT_199585 [Phyllosticta paracitricarpa]